jgi:hypothetical protein
MPDSYSGEGYIEKPRGFDTLTIAYSNGVCAAAEAWAIYEAYRRRNEIEILFDSYKPKDIIELSKSVYQVKTRGEWHLSETTAKLRKLFEKLNIDSLF